MSDFGFFLRQRQKDQDKLDELEGRELEQAETFADLRRGEFQDRTGFGGLVNVGDAARRSDATLAAEFADRDVDDPVQQAYQDALAAERGTRAKQTRVITGEQFRAEDAKAALEERLKSTVTISDQDTLRSDYEAFSREFEFIEGDDFVGRAQRASKANRKARQAASDRLQAAMRDRRNRANFGNRARRRARRTRRKLGF